MCELLLLDIKSCNKTKTKFGAPVAELSSAKQQNHTFFIFAYSRSVLYAFSNDDDVALSSKIIK